MLCIPSFGLFSFCQFPLFFGFEELFQFGNQNQAATGKRDTSYMGRFTVRTFTEFEGLGRILTIVARGYLFKENENPYERIEYARNALCAWCSIPEKTKMAPEGKLNPKVNFSDLASTFPELVDENGRCRFPPLR